MNSEIKKLRAKWLERIYAKGGIIYKSAQKELIESFIKDVEEISNKSLKDWVKD